MFALMNRQVSFLFADTESLRDHTPEALVIYGNALTTELLALLPALTEKGCTVYCVGSCDAPLPAGVIRLEQAAALPMRSKLGGQQDGVAARWEQDRVLLANSDAREKVLTLSGNIRSITELYTNEAIPFSAENGHAAFTLPPYGVVLATLNN